MPSTDRRAGRARPYVGVVGPGDADEEERAHARAVGALAARRGAIVVCGGLGGVMEACAEGATSEGGTVVGLLPGDDRGAGNEHLTVALATGLGQLRNGLLVRSCDGLVAVGGGWGTMSEIALALRTGRPVAVLRGWRVTGPDGSIADTDGLLAHVASEEAAVAHALGDAAPFKGAAEGAPA